MGCGDSIGREVGAGVRGALREVKGGIGYVIGTYSNLTDHGLHILVYPGESPRMLQ